MNTAIFPDYKACICGVHSQGKTTLINSLRESTYLTHDLKFSFRINLTRDLGKIIGINEAGGDVSQYLVMARHLEYALAKDRWILDRGALDGLAYSYYFLYNLKLSPEIYNALKYMFFKCMKYYNRVFIINNELPLVSDGTRSVEQEFFDGVSKGFDHLLTTLYSTEIQQKIVKVSGTVEERTNIVIDTIKKDFKNGS